MNEVLDKFLVYTTVQRVLAYRRYREQTGAYWSVDTLERLHWTQLYKPVSIDGNLARRSGGNNAAEKRRILDIRTTFCNELEIDEELLPEANLKIFYKKHQDHATLPLRYPTATVHKDSMAKPLVDAYCTLIHDVQHTVFTYVHRVMHDQVADQSNTIVWPLASAEACAVASYARALCKEQYKNVCYKGSALTDIQQSWGNWYPPIDFQFWVMYGSWSMCPDCGSFFFNDDYFRQKVYHNEDASSQPELIAAHRRAVPSDPMVHEHGQLGVSSRWWYLQGMYSPKSRCGSCTKPPEAAATSGEEFTRTLTAHTERYNARAAASASGVQAEVHHTGQMYRIPRISETFRAEECITWPRYYDGHYKMQTCGESMLDLSRNEADALRIVVLRCNMKKESYTPAGHQFNFKKVGLSRAYFKPALVTEASLIAACNEKTAAAFRFLMARNRYYAAFHRMHKERLENSESMNISSYHLFIHREYLGIECAMCPYLYPLTEFSDTGLLQAYQHDTGDDTTRIHRIGHSWTKKVLSSVRAYSERADLSFFLYERSLAAKYFAARVLAKQRGLTADVLARDSQTSTGYWENVQHAVADVVRVQLARCHDEENYTELYNNTKNLRGEGWLCAFPNVFITLTVAEWKFPRPYFLRPYVDCVYASAYVMALHCFYLVACVWGFLASRCGNRWFVVYEWCSRTEYQGRGTPHWHICAWVATFGMLSLLKGRSGTALISVFCKFLELVFMCHVDVLVGNGLVNYISGYVSKDHDAVDVGLGEYVQTDALPDWLATYRLLCKSTPCIPEVAIRMAGLSEWRKSYSSTLLYPPQPADMVKFEARRHNFSTKMYGTYTAEARAQLESGVPLKESFLVWHRSRQWDDPSNQMKFRGGRHNQRYQKTLVVGCRYWYELTDGFWGQFALTQLPHRLPADLLPQEYRHLESMQHFTGALEYICSWKWHAPGIIYARDGVLFHVSALPLLVSDTGEVHKLAYSEGAKVFTDDNAAFKYLLLLATRDLQYNGKRDNTIRCFTYKQEANFLLYSKVCACTDAHEYEMLRQDWDEVNRPRYREFDWSGQQQKALALIKERLSYDDEDEKVRSRDGKMCLYVAGAPGSGKSAVILEAAIRAAKAGMSVLNMTIGSPV